jgi:uncharacterized protein (TIGR02599 family)
MNFRYRRQILPERRCGFTLIEMMVATAILSIILLITVSVVNLTSSTIRVAGGGMDAFAEARAAFDMMRQRLAQATLNTYWGYIYGPNGNPTSYGRQSDLQFVIQTTQTTSSYGGDTHAIFFQGPEALSQIPTYGQAQGLLNGFGYFVQYGSDGSPGLGVLPTHVANATVPQERYRYRLMQAIQSTENLSAMDNPNWLQGWPGTPGAVTSANAWPIADNVIALMAWPRLPALQDPTGIELSANYQYNSYYSPSSTTAPTIQQAQMPPVVQLLMVAIDEASAIRIDTKSATEPTAIHTALTTGSPLPFTNVSNYLSDLQNLETALNGDHINYQVFSASVVIRESQWSESP